jgi:hypothetical protein
MRHIHFIELDTIDARPFQVYSTRTATTNRKTLGWITKALSHAKMHLTSNKIAKLFVFIYHVGAAYCGENTIFAM